MMGVAPVIIIGMHRSGTSMVTRILESMGLFVGDQKDGNHESLFFLELNEWMLSQANTTWDFPDRFRFVDQALSDCFQQVLRRQLELHSPDHFLGPRLAATYRNVFDLDRPWGWKDPRTTLTFPHWVRVFPDSRVVHVVRNPVDVAESLRVRERDYFEKIRDALRQHPETLDSGDIKLQRSPRLFHLDEGIELWKEYVQAGLDAESLMPEANVFRLKYEDFLESPADILRRLAAFCGLSVTDAGMRNATRDLNPSRRYSFRGKPELVEAFERIRNDPLVARMGYDR